jgi:hypothetical protein
MTSSVPFVFRWGDEPGVRSWARAVDAGATVALHAGADDGWQRLDAPERFADWAAVVARRLPACRSWITVVGMNRWPVERYAALRRLATGRLLRAFDHQLAAHALVAEVLAEAAPGSVVDPGLVPDDRAYELHQLLRDVLDAPAAGVARADIDGHLRARKAAFEAAHPATTPRQRVLRRLAASAIPLEQALPRALGAVYDTARVAA